MRTPGLLTVDEVYQEHVRTVEGRSIADCCRTPTSAEGRANARHIVACWNACEGINPESVPDLLAALRLCEEAMSSSVDGRKQMWAGIDAARAAIAKATQPTA
jgi:hypothetical protein